MKMKKILIYGLSNMYGGVEAFILNYVNHLPENKYTVELIIMNRTPQYLGEKLKREVKIHYVPERIKNPLGYNCRVNEIVKKGNWGDIGFIIHFAIFYTIVLVKRNRM